MSIVVHLHFDLFGIIAIVTMRNYVNVFQDVYAVFYCHVMSSFRHILLVAT